MPKDVLYGKTLRKSFARTQEIREMPNLLEIQKSSYKWFLETGLREVFKDVDSVTDYSGNLELSFIDYSMNEKPKYDEEECKARDATYAAPLKVRVRLRNKETEEIKEQEIFMGDIFVITPLPKALCLTLSPRAKVSIFSGFGVSGAEAAKLSPLSLKRGRCCALRSSQDFSRFS